MQYYETTLWNKNRGYMRLIVWQKAMRLFELVWKIAFEEAKIDFKLRSQIADAAQSVAANMAEGQSRRSVGEYIQFLHTALGSLAETLTRVIGSQRSGQIPDARFEEPDRLHDEVEHRLLRLIDKIERKRDDQDWIGRISQDPSECLPESPPLHRSTTLPLPAAAHA